jgi:hypothetical protein
MRLFGSSEFNQTHTKIGAEILRASLFPIHQNLLQNVVKNIHKPPD